MKKYFIVFILFHCGIETFAEIKFEIGTQTFFRNIETGQVKGFYPNSPIGEWLYYGESHDGKALYYRTVNLRETPKLVFREVEKNKGDFLDAFDPTNLGDNFSEQQCLQKQVQIVRDFLNHHPEIATRIASTEIEVSYFKPTIRIILIKDTFLSEEELNRRDEETKLSRKQTFYEPAAITSVSDYKVADEDGPVWVGYKVSAVYLKGGLSASRCYLVSAEDLLKKW